MAQPIEFQAPAAAPPNPERLQNAPAEHAEALLSAYELLQLLHDRGVLDLLRGLVGGGDELIGAFTAAVNTPEAIQGIRNFLLLTKFFASIPPDVLNSMADTVAAGARKEKARQAPGLFRLLWRLRNENCRYAASIAIDLLEGLGRGL